MNIDLTSIIVSIITIIPLLLQIKKNNTNSQVNHNEQIKISRSTQCDIKALSTRMDALEEKEDANLLQTCRIDLRQALYHSPDNIPAILELARIYFINLHGNADLGRKFLGWVKEYRVQDWAAAHDEDISNLIKAATHSA